MVGGGQRPFHTGGRFSANARAPSWASSETKTGAISSACLRHPSAKVQSCAERAIC